MARPANPWIQRPRPNPGAKVRLICIPYAGGSASVFRTWPDALPPYVEVLAVALPGREMRIKQPPLEHLPPLLAGLGDALAPELDRPYAIYGHSLGAMIGFYLARELRRRGLPAPLHLFASGRRPPHLAERTGAHKLPDAEFVRELDKLGGMPAAFLESRELLAVFLPILRADFALNESAVFEPGAPLDCPITAMGGSDDQASTTLAELAAWGEHTRAGCDSQVFTGNHFFLQSARDAVLGLVSRKLADHAPGGAGW